MYETGRSVWIFRFQQFNHKHSETLGTFPKLSIKDASEMLDAKNAFINFALAKNIEVTNMKLQKLVFFLLMVGI